MKRSIVAAAALGSLGVAAVALRSRKSDVTDDRLGVSRSVTIRRPAGELYPMWRSADTLARFLHLAKSVEERGGGRQHWSMAAGKQSFEFDVSLVDERPGLRLEWRADPQDQPPFQAGVTFSPAPGERRTAVCFTLALAAPGAGLATALHRPFACIDAVGMEAHGLTALALLDQVKNAVKLEQDRPHVLREPIQTAGKGATASLAGVYTGFVDTIPFGAAFAKGLTFKMGQTHVHRYLRPLLQRIERGELDASASITHRGRLEDAPQFYDIFQRHADGCEEVVMTTA